ncbi:transglycosylase SLT domain-containing protein [Patescibacteria group bacterium]
MLTQPWSRIKLTALIAIVVLVIVSRNKPQDDFINPVSSPSASPIIPSPEPSAEASPSASPIPSPKPTPTPKPSPTPSPSPSPQPSFSGEEIHGFMEKYANEYGIDVNILRHIAVCESGFDPLASNLSYAGLYQFSPNTWVNYRNMLSLDSDIDLRFHAEEAVRTAAYILSINRAYIWPNCVPN